MNNNEKEKIIEQIRQTLANGMEKRTFDLSERFFKENEAAKTPDFVIKKVKKCYVFIYQIDEMVEFF